MIQNNIKETKKLSLAPIWNLSSILSNKINISNKNDKKNFYDLAIKKYCEILQIEISDWENNLSNSKKSIIVRGESEIKYWENKISLVKKYSKEQAIEELIIALKPNEKIKTIRKYIDSLKAKVD